MPSSPLPPSVAKRLETRLAHDGVAVVVARKGSASRVFGFDEYVKMKAVPKKHKPWLRRRAAPDPLRAVEGTVKSRLSRAHIYTTKVKFAE